MLIFRRFRLDNIRNRALSRWILIHGRLIMGNVNGNIYTLALKSSNKEGVQEHPLFSPNTAKSETDELI
jgi:hypothetical protein